MKDYPFRHVGPDGKVYLHWENWNRFVEMKEEEYPHDWGHNRCFLRILACDSPTLDEVIDYVQETWSVIFEPFPAYWRTKEDPEGWGESYHLWIEDNQKQTDENKVCIIYMRNPANLFPDAKYVYFQKKWWKVDLYEHYGLGRNAPKVAPPPTLFRDIYEDFESTILEES
jgi:hypothetical protein